MSNFSEFVRPKPVEKPQGMTIDGNFQCQHCGVRVDEGTYYPVDSVLVWLCSDGHKSFIKGFSLG